VRVALGSWDVVLEAAVDPSATRQSHAGPAVTMSSQKIAGLPRNVPEPATGSSQTARPVTTRSPKPAPHDRERLLHRTGQGVIMSTAASVAASANLRRHRPQPQPAIEDNALIGDLLTAALVAKDSLIA
jgi:hypothetical protein